MSNENMDNGCDFSQLSKSSQTGNRQKLLQAARKKRSLKGSFLSIYSFTLIYVFYTSYFLDSANSPVLEAVRSVGGKTGAMNICLLVILPGAISCFSSAWMRLVTRRMSVRIVLHVCTFATPMLVPLVPTAWMAYTLLTVFAFCGGATAARALYTTIFVTMDVHPTRIIVAMYAVMQAYLYAFLMIPALHTLPIYYAVGAPTLLIGVILSFIFDGDDMERRRILPENKLRRANIWPFLAIIALAQICFALYNTILLPQTTLKPWDSSLQIVPNALTLLVFFLAGKRMTFRGVLTGLATLFACSAFAFIVANKQGLAVIQMFTEPTFLMFDLFFIWLLQSTFRTYSRNLIQLKVFVAADIAVATVFIVLARQILSYVPLGTGYALLLLPPAFALALLIPQADRAVWNMSARRAYAEGYHETEVPLPDQRADVLATRSTLLDTLPAGVTLTNGEQIALCYMIDGQHTDVMAHFMSIPMKKAQALTASVISKFGYSTKTELIEYIGAMKAEAGRRERIPTLLEQYGLSEREKEIFQAILTASLEQGHIYGDELPTADKAEILLSPEEIDVAMLLIEGGTRSDIARKFHLNAAEIDQRLSGIRSKINQAGDPDPVVAAAVATYKLTRREIHILRCLRRQMTNTEIAAELFLSEETIRVHVHNLMKKLPVKSRREVATWDGTISP